MKKLLSFLLIFFLTSCETVSDFSMPNLGMPDLAKYNINPFSRNSAQELTCPKPMILADAISITEFKDFGSNEVANIIYRGRIDRINYECNIEPNYTIGNILIIGTLSLVRMPKIISIIYLPLWRLLIKIKKLFHAAMLT